MATSRLETLEEMLKADPSNFQVRFGLALEYLKAERYQDAITAFEEYLREADDEGAAFGMLARAYEKLGQRDKASASYKRGITAATTHGHPSMAEEYKTTLSTEYED